MCYNETNQMNYASTTPSAYQRGYNDRQFGHSNRANELYTEAALRHLYTEGYTAGSKLK